MRFILKDDNNYDVIIIIISSISCSFGKWYIILFSLELVVGEMGETKKAPTHRNDGVGAITLVLTKNLFFKLG